MNETIKQVVAAEGVIFGLGETSQRVYQWDRGSIAWVPYWDTQKPAEKARVADQIAAQFAHNEINNARNSSK